MPRFTQTVRSDDRISTTPDRVWAVLTDPQLLAQLTPLVDTITPDGDLWRWRLTRISGLGMSAAPQFTTLVRLQEGRRIDFEPPPGARDRASAAGFLTVQPEGEETVVAIDVTATVDLPLPRAMQRPVRALMYRTMRAGGTRFARNLVAHLGDPPHRGLRVHDAGSG